MEKGMSGYINIKQQVIVLACSPYQLYICGTFWSVLYSWGEKALLLSLISNYAILYLFFLFLHEYTTDKNGTYDSILVGNLSFKSTNTPFHEVFVLHHFMMVGYCLLYTRRSGKFLTLNRCMKLDQQTFNVFIGDRPTIIDALYRLHFVLYDNPLKVRVFGFLTVR